MFKVMNGNKKLIAFGWYGGKFSHLDWLLPLLPNTNHFCEPFAGSAAVLLNRDPSPVETYNDIDGEVVNFFKILRDKKEDLLYAIGMTPFSREEFKIAIQALKEPNKFTDFERARLFYVRARQVRTGLAQSASNGRWANCLNTSRAGMAGAVSRWLGSVEGLEYIAARLLRVQIENDDALKIIQRYDSDETLFYCDPPYIHSTRGDNNAYGNEMTDNDHIKLAEIVNSSKGLFAISNYDCDLMNELYPLPKWKKYISPPKVIHSTKDLRQEVLWVNYDLDKLSKNLFNK